MRILLVFITVHFLSLKIDGESCPEINSITDFAIDKVLVLTGYFISSSK
jgi:hypothetical protein